MVQSEENLIVLVGEIVFEGQAGIVLVVVVGTQEVNGAKGDPLSPFEPSDSLLGPPSPREDRDLHALTEEGSFFCQVYESEATNTQTRIRTSKKEPVIVAIRIHIVFN